MISIVPRFTREQIRTELEKRAGRIRLAIISRLQFVGETALTYARDNGAYKDRTGNLRSSIGYVILENGTQIKSSFPGAQSEGKRKAKDVIDQNKSNFSRGFVLIVVAGMEYAASVESLGYDVLTASSQIAADELKRAMKELTKKIENLK